jgi:hypothetical protein
MADKSSVFDMNTITPTKTKIDAGTDSHISIKGSAANWGGITGDGFLSGPQPGQEQLLVKGNQTARTTGNRHHHIQGHLTTTIISGEDRNVTMGRSTIIGPNETLTINGERVMTITGSNMRTILGPYLDTNVGPKTRNEVSSWFANEGWFKVKAGLVTVQIYANKSELLGLKAGLSAIKTEGVLIKNETIALWLATGLLAACLTVARPKIGVAKPDIGGVSTHAWYVGV